MSLKPLFVLVFFLTLHSSLTGCNLAPSYIRPTLDIPKDWSDKAPYDKEKQTDIPSPTDWWKLFKHPELEKLIAESLIKNHDLKAAFHRVSQARATEKIATTSLFPAIGITADISRNRKRSISGTTSFSDGYTAGSDISYELDLFGRNRTQASYTRSLTKASLYAHQALMLIITSDVALAYTEILTLNGQIHVASQQLDNAKEILRITEARLFEGQISALEVAQQKTELSNQQANIASLENQRSQALHRLAVLVGTVPQSLTIPKANITKLVFPRFPISRPATLLTRRPDIQEAETRLIAAHANIGAARAAFFPSLSIGAGVALATSPVQGPASTAASLLSSATVPIFQGGRLKGGLLFATAQRDELIETYKKTILVAFQETENALANEKSAGKRVKAYTTAVAEARLAYQIAREQLDAGRIDFISVLDTQRSLLQAEDALIRARYEKISATVQLVKALGGGW